MKKTGKYDDAFPKASATINSFGRISDQLTHEIREYIPTAKVKTRVMVSFSLSDLADLVNEVNGRIKGA